MKFITIENSVLSENTYLVWNENTLRGFLIDPGSDGKKIEKAAAERNIKIEAVFLTHGHFDHALSAKYFQERGAKVYVHAEDADKLTSGTAIDRFFGVKFPTFFADVTFETDNNILKFNEINSKTNRNKTSEIRAADSKTDGDKTSEIRAADSKTGGNKTSEIQGADSKTDGDNILNSGGNVPRIEKDNTVEFQGMRFKIIHTPGHSKGGVCYFFEDEGALFSGDTLFSGDIGRSDFVDGDFFELKNSIISKLFALPDGTAVYPGHEEATEIGKERNNKRLFGE
ncbi:MAG: MBL fold metallo-hydrolase [Clostridiales bacterium]|jgi:glyoxylase-like metal-dependent hydrolase (beta-lactamase superfamily II)|nr:MBL fold metallo-hydrolase [Clostridiales bacterium]